MGPGDVDTQAATVRADYPLPADCPLYYFEIKVLDKGQVRSGSTRKREKMFLRGTLCDFSLADFAHFPIPGAIVLHNNDPLAAIVG